MEAPAVAHSSPAEVLPGTLDLLVLRTLARGPNHGYGIAQRVRELSHDVFQLGESSLYPALQRLTLDGYIRPEWGVSENNRKARYYKLTAAGRRRTPDAVQAAAADEPVFARARLVWIPFERRGRSLLDPYSGLALPEALLD